jgi:multidrug efflux pump subunit AcrB
MSRNIVQASRILLAAILVIGCGCRKPSPPAAVKIVVEYPGASPKIVDDVVCAPIRQQLIGVEHASAIISVSSNNLAEIYVQCMPNMMDVSMLSVLVDNRAQLAAPVLPMGATIKKAVDVSGQTIPPALHIHDVDCPDVHVDPLKASRLGISMSTVTNAVQEAMKSGEKLSEVTVKSSTGEKVRLTGFATIKTVREPNHIIVRWPSAEEQGK